jgi:hypothetical protein
MLSPTQLKLDGTAVKNLGLEGLNPQHVDLATATILARSICPCEAAHILAGRPIIYHSEPVTFLATHPPEWRRVPIVHRNGMRMAGISNTPLQSYINRPHKPQFENLTLTQYFEWHDVSTGAQHAPLVCAGSGMSGWCALCGKAMILIYHSALSTAD